MQTETPEMKFGWSNCKPSVSHSYLVGRLLKIVRGRVRRSGEIRIIDIGCGNGAVTNVIHTHGFDVVGVEPSVDGIAEARRAFPHLRVEQGSAYDDLQGRFGRFDIAVCLEVVEHLYSPQIAMASISRLLNPGGIVVLSTPYHSYAKNLALCLAGKWDFHHHPLVEHGHIKFWSRATLERLIETSALRPTEFHRLGRVPILAKSMMLVAEKPDWSRLRAMTMAAEERQAGRGSEAPSLDAIVLSHNEERHIETLLRNLNDLDCRAFVVDSSSTDRTVELAQGLGAHVVQHPFVNYALQFQWALDNLPIDSEWVMRLDADEVLTPELVEEIRRRLPELPPDVTGVNLKRRHIFLGRWIRHGGRYPLTLLRIWRKGAARIEQRWMDEHMVLLHGRAVTFEHDFSDHNLNDLTFFTDKHNKYATREAIDVLMRRYGLGAVDEALTRESASRQAAGKRWIKERVYNRAPVWLGPLGYFLYRYFIQLGILDGREGLIYHGLQGLWYRFLVGAKVVEFDRALRPLADPGARLAALARLTGYSLADLERRP